MKTTSLTLAVLGVAAAVAGCGSSVAPGITPAPGAGATADTTTVASASSSSTTTSATTTSSVKLPAALNTKPKVVPPSGPAPKSLLVKDLIKGTGPAATAGSTVTVQYVGVLYKGGKQFDASWNDGQGKPVTFPLSGVIKGWQQGIPGMRVGGRRELVIPPSLAYGSTAQAKIPANSTLVFVIDLHSIS
ncbi:MAG TPA: FKBP-type peptidyl-prolyl cis-trans isomerase [Solirubrobacteraceae bacterium]|jgi:peptidylprolyl isomerase|nr:FKBP-type peptidyl-prolyl cis-trans isomerase [Solirubrobacteraceae bacterium]